MTLETDYFPAVELLSKAALNFFETHDPPLVIDIWNTQAHALLPLLAHKTQSFGWQQSQKTTVDRIQKLGLTRPKEPLQTCDLALVFPSKNKQQSLFHMAKAMLSLNEGGTMIMACANNHGAKSYQHALGSLAGHVNAESKSKCRIFSARKNDRFDITLADQWLEAGSAHKVENLALYSQAGLFSWDRPDMGSQLLLQHLPAFSGTGMDLCCGYGLLSTHLLKHNPDISKLHLLDVDQHAI
ncbi:MAG: methyltransferase, partial [Mariprofundaceae bacterium]|nr:methyltransferase [Mariprofundaceae bacterium]